MYWERIIVGERERVLVFKDHQFSGILMPGLHRILATSCEAVETEKHRLDDLVFESEWGDYLISQQPKIAGCHFTRVETNSTQVAMIYVNGALYTVLVPQKRLLFWRDAALVTAEVVSVIGDSAVRSRADTFDSDDAWSRTYTCL